MPPADPSRAANNNHVASTSLMLQEQPHHHHHQATQDTHMQQQERVTSMQLPSPAHTASEHQEQQQQVVPEHAAATAAAAKLRLPQHEQQQPHMSASASAPPPAATDSEDDSWTPGQPQSSSTGEEEEPSAAAAAGASAAAAAAEADSTDAGADDTPAASGEGDSDMMAAYDDLDDAYEDEAGWDPALPPPVYCTNCTARLYIAADRCSDCGHSNDEDSQLLSCTAASAAAADADAAAGGGDDGPVPLIIWDDSMLLHEEGKLEPHPERPDRLRAVMAQLQGNGVAGMCQRVPARLATKEELLRVHTPDHLHRLQLFCSGQVPPSAIPSDTYINQHTLQCAALAAGSAAEVAVRVWRGEAPAGAAIIRPPGHHAESNTAMGFCFFNNAAVAARAVQAAGGGRVLILDWDVHHGNGTQHIFEADDSVMYMSLHRYDRGSFYPGTGAASEVGHGAGEGFTVNVPWDTDGVEDGDYMAAMQQVLLPVAREFAPDIILISAGFDAAAGDPIGGCNLTPACFGAMTAALMPVAPTVLLLEGGYNLRSTALSTEACLRVLLGEPAPQLLGCGDASGEATSSNSNAPCPSPYAWLSIQAARKAHSRYWSCLAGAQPPPPPQLLGHFAAGWGIAAAAAGGVDRQQQQQGSEGLELQYEDGFSEPEFNTSEEEGEEGESDDDADAAAEAATADAASLQPRRPNAAASSSAAAAATASAGSKRGADDQEQQGSDGGVDAGHRRVRFAAAAAAGPVPLLLPRTGSSGGESSGSFGRGGNRPQHLGGAARVTLSRKQQMLKAIHKKAMQLFLRKQRKIAARQQQQQQEALQQQQQ